MNSKVMGKSVLCKTITPGVLILFGKIMILGPHLQVYFAKNATAGIWVSWVWCQRLWNKMHIKAQILWHIYYSLFPKWFLEGI